MKRRTASSPVDSLTQRPGRLRPARALSRCETLRRAVDELFPAEDA
jgi:hypothetical protein